MKNSHLRFSFNAVACKSGSCVFIYLCTVAFYLDNHDLLVAKINFIPSNRFLAYTTSVEAIQHYCNLTYTVAKLHSCV